MIKISLPESEHILAELRNGVIEGVSSGKCGRAWLSGEFELCHLEALCVRVRDVAGDNAQGAEELFAYWRAEEMLNGDVPKFEPPPNEHRDLAIRALRNMMSDDLVRARNAFRGMSAEEMQHEHGQSGRTRAEILAGYETHDAQVNAAIEWLRGAA